MSVPVRWLLQRRELALRLSAGENGADRGIDFVAPTELLDPRPWLSGGELLLTTGLALQPSEGAAYVRRLVEANVAALGFGTGLSHSVVPTSVRAEADALGLSVVEVPFDTPFAVVNRAVVNRLAEQEYELVRRAADTQVRITRAALRGGVRAIVRELAVATDASVAYVAERTEAIVAHPPSSGGDLAAEVAALRREGSVAVSGPGRALIVQPVTQGRVAEGHLAVRAPRPLQSVELVLLGHAVSLLTLELDKPRRLRDERNRLGANAFRLLLAGALAHEEAMEFLGDAVGSGQRVRVLRLHGQAPAVVRALDTELAQRDRSCYVVTDEDGVTVLLRGGDDVSTVESLLARVPSARTRTLRAGLSAPHRLGDAAAALTQAEHALAAADSARRVVEFDPTRGTTLLGSPAVRTALEAVAASTVDVLVAYDAAHGTALVVSVRAFLEANGHWESAAAEIDVHRHTLRNRIAKAEQVLDVDLGDARVRAELLLALLL